MHLIINSSRLVPFYPQIKLLVGEFQSPRTVHDMPWLHLDASLVSSHHLASLISLKLWSIGPESLLSALRSSETWRNSLSLEKHTLDCGRISVCGDNAQTTGEGS